ncbi:MAG: hypothetical protein KF861_04420, partial [Planctomycetaceae bacterium]|nr:hypothetical protein [Planctomycetaceae bacterium]
MENIRHVLASRPWATNQNIVRNAPFGFLMPGDGHLLYYLAKDAVCGDGAVVDAGSFVGRSAWFLAHGLEDNSRPTTDALQVHCFDNFLVNGEMTVHAIARHSGNELKVGDRTRF